MKKSVYSLVLMDDVIRAVDEQAYRLGTSRSNLINQILAEHLSYTTPEMHMNNIFGAIANMTEKVFQIQQNRSDAPITLRTALQFKYRPTLNYKVELMRSPDMYVGTLRVQIRSQNDSLIRLFDSFFAYWIKMESESFSKLSLDNLYACEFTSGCFRRRLLYAGKLSDEEIGERIYAYIDFLDRNIKRYFASPQSFPNLLPEIKNEYINMISQTII